MGMIHSRRVIIDGLLYLTRWFLTPRAWRFPRVFLHRISLPDAGRDMHDHPWDFWTLRLWGWYVEIVGASTCNLHKVPNVRCGLCARMHQAWEERTGWRPRFRLAEHVHRIKSVSKGGCWTLVVAMPARRAWGFWQRGGWRSAEAMGIKNEPEDNILKGG